MKKVLLLAALAAAAANAQTVRNIKDVVRCPNTPDGRQPYRLDTPTGGDLRKVVIQGPNAVCNDGTPAFMYVRAARPGATEPDGPSANRWIIHLLGGSSCSDFLECATRWCGIGQWEGTLMTTAFSGDFRNVDGLLARNATNRLADRNEVLMKYCSSDQWQGRSPTSSSASTPIPLRPSASTSKAPISSMRPSRCSNRASPACRS